MVKIHVKKGDESQFLHETTVNTPVEDFLQDAVTIYNGRLKIDRISAEMEELSKHGLTLPPNMQGLTDEQIEELKLRDEWAEKCQPSGGAVFNKDTIGRRNGQAPSDKMGEMLRKTIKEAKDMVSKKNIENNRCVTQVTVKEALDILRGATMIVYPMGLPPHEPIKMEFDNEEDLSGTQASLDVINPTEASVWFSGKEMLQGKKLSDYVGKNEKTKIVGKLQKRGQGPPSREPVVTEDVQKQMMAHYYRRQEDLKKLDTEAEDAYLDSPWADGQQLKRQFQGLNNIKWGPR